MVKSFTMLMVIVVALFTGATSASADYVSEVLSDNPIGYWRFGEAGGATAVDLSGNGRDLTLNNFGPGNFGQPGAIVGDADTAFGFAPIGGNAPSGSPTTHPTAFSPNTTDFGFASGQSFSVEYWIKLAPGNTSTDNAGIITKGYDSTQAQPWYLSRYNKAQGGTVDFFLRNPDDRFVTSTSRVDDNQWHHVVGVYDSSETSLSIYVDGIKESSRSDIAPSNYGTNARPLSIGNHLNRGVDGQLDEVAVYDSALSVVQVQNHYVAATGMLPDAPSSLNIDFGNSIGAGNGPGGVHPGFTAFEETESAGTVDRTRTFLSSLGAGNTVDVTIGGFTHFRDYAAVTGDFVANSPLLSDMVLRNADGTMTLTLENLNPGDYLITTFHHSTQFGGGLIDINLNDANGTGQSIETSLPVTNGGAPTAISSSTFGFTSDGSPVSIDFLGGAGPQHLSLNGFSLALDAPSLPAVLAVDINDRGAAGPGSTQTGFDEFLIGGAEDNDITTSTTRNYGPYTVTIGSSAGSRVGDRRRDQPVDAGLFFTDGQLLRDFIFMRDDNANDSLDVLIEGLDANTEYKVTIWSFDDLSSNPRVSDWFANGNLVMDDYIFDGNAVPPSPADNGVYSFDFVAMSNAAGEILISGVQAGSNNPGVFLNAFSISRASPVIPEPTTIGLLAIGAAGLTVCRRRHA